MPADWISELEQLEKKAAPGQWECSSTRYQGAGYKYREISTPLRSTWVIKVLACDGTALSPEPPEYAASGQLVVALRNEAPRLIAIAKAAEELRRLRSTDGPAELSEQGLWDAIDAALLELDAALGGGQ